MASILPNPRVFRRMDRLSQPQRRHRDARERMQEAEPEPEPPEPEPDLPCAICREETRGRGGQLRPRLADSPQCGGEGRREVKRRREEGEERSSRRDQAEKARR